MSVDTAPPGIGGTLGGELVFVCRGSCRSEKKSGRRIAFALHWTPAKKVELESSRPTRAFQTMAGLFSKEDDRLLQDMDAESTQPDSPLAGAGYGKERSDNLCISLKSINKAQESMQRLSAGDLMKSHLRFDLEHRAEKQQQPMSDFELDMELADPIDTSYGTPGRDPNCFKSFWDCCRGMRD